MLFLNCIDIACSIYATTLQPFQKSTAIASLCFIAANFDNEQHMEIVPWCINGINVLSFLDLVPPDLPLHGGARVLPPQLDNRHFSFNIQSCAQTALSGTFFFVYETNIFFFFFFYFVEQTFYI